MSDAHKAAERQSAQKEFLFETVIVAIVDQTFYDLLSQEGVLIHEYRAREHIRLGEKNDAYRALRGACRYLVKGCGDKVRALIDALDISPTALRMTYHHLANGLFQDGCNWGQVVMLVSASSLLAARVHRNGDAKSVESVHQWMSTYILRSLKPWIVQQHHGWAGLSEKFMPGKETTDVPTVRRDGKWWPAAVFVLATVVGATILLGSRS